MDIRHHEKHLSNLAVELEKARTRRMETLQEIRRVSAQAELTRDRKIIGTLPPLNKSEEADARLIKSLELQIKDVKRQLDLARGQAAAVASRLAAALPGGDKTRFFDVRTPSGKIVRHKHSTLDALRRELQPGYTAVAEIFACDDEGVGGFPVAIGQRASLLKALQEMSA
ncbi:MAG: hypothetical protein ABSD11_15950 [Methylocella sp.]|jgi:hypothetical protein